jgi:hypothetical protein
MKVELIKDSNGMTYKVRKYKGYFVQNYYGPFWDIEPTKQVYIVSKLTSTGHCVDIVGEYFETVEKTKSAILGCVDFDNENNL